MIGNATDPPPGLVSVELLVRPSDKGDGFSVEDTIEFQNQTEVGVEFEWDPAVDGNYDLALRATDSFGNTGMSPIHSVTVDRIPPSPTPTETSTPTPTFTSTPTITLTPSWTPLRLGLHGPRLATRLRLIRLSFTPRRRWRSSPR